MEIYQSISEPVLRSYSGKAGCMCGCRGKYSEIQDHPVAVARMINKLNKILTNQPGARDQVAEIDVCDGYVYVEFHSGRVNAVYFK